MKYINGEAFLSIKSELSPLTFFMRVVGLIVDKSTVIVAKKKLFVFKIKKLFFVDIT